MKNIADTIISQYANSPIILQIINGLNVWLDPAADIDAFYNLLWNVDTAQGYGLDVWGRIVGVGRVYQISAGDYLGFTGPAGVSGKPFRQAPFYFGQATTSNYALLDDPYRALIFAKAMANISDGTIGSINQILINLFGPGGLLSIPGNSFCTDDGNMTMTYTFGSALDPVRTAIVFQSGVLPRPAGVALTIVVSP